MSNILNAIKNIIEDNSICIQENNTGFNRANNMGDGLEEFIKDAFAGTLKEKNLQERLNKFEEVFSYIGNQNNPPDIILKNGDAIEVKKIQSMKSGIALNSSYPKNKLYIDDTRITNVSKHCEIWQQKDIIYIIGSVINKNLKTIWFVYGDCYAADRKIYQRIADTISLGLNNIPEIELARTNELGGVKRVDPLGITNLRIRGMWHIEHPFRAFSYLSEYKENEKLKLYCIMRNDKYFSFNEQDRNEIENIPFLNISDVKIKNPNNPAQLIECKFMEYDCGK